MYVDHILIPRSSTARCNINDLLFSSQFPWIIRSVCAQVFVAPTHSHKKKKNKHHSVQIVAPGDAPLPAALSPKLGGSLGVIVGDPGVNDFG